MIIHSTISHIDIVYMVELTRPRIIDHDPVAWNYGGELDADTGFTGFRGFTKVGVAFLGWIFGIPRFFLKCFTNVSGSQNWDRFFHCTELGSGDFG